MNAPMMPLNRRDRDADRPEAERVVAVLYEQIGEINKIVAGEEDAATIAELERLRDDLRIAGDLLCAYASGLALDFEGMDENAFFHLRNLVRFHSLDPDAIDKELSIPAFNAKT